jgi:hypothetical protein
VRALDTSQTKRLPAANVRAGAYEFERSAEPSS